jgi:PhnB protein
MAAKPKKKVKAKAKAILKKVAKKKASSKVTSKAKPAPKSARAKAPAAKPQAAEAPRYHTVTPMLNIAGADAAIAFYKEAFGAQERVRMPGPDGKVMHAEIVIGDSVVMISDVWQNPATVSALHVYVPDCDALYSQAVAAGASPKMPLQDMFWGDRFGTLTDPFGNIWSIATHKEDVSPEEMQKRMAALPPPGTPPAAA